MAPVYSDCDSPFTLTNFTLDFLEKHWAKEVDFVICASDVLPFTSVKKGTYTKSSAFASRMQ